MKLLNIDNLKFESDDEYDLIYCDMIYENLDFSWVDHFWKFLRDGGIFIIQTDYHSVAEVKVHTKQMPKAQFVNWLIWKNEFGNFRKDRFRQCHDDILIFCKGKGYKWYPDRIQVPKVTAKAKGLNPSGRETKLATSVIMDITLTTTATERVKMEDGHNIRWQKPLKLYDRIIYPFVDVGDKVLDPFMGSGSLCLWCNTMGMDYTGIELSHEVYKLAKENVGV